LGSMPDVHSKAHEDWQSRVIDALAYGLRAHGIQLMLLAAVLLLRKILSSVPMFWSVVAALIIFVYAWSCFVSLPLFRYAALGVIAVVATANAFIKIPRRIQA